MYLAGVVLARALVRHLLEVILESRLASRAAGTPLCDEMLVLVAAQTLQLKTTLGKGTFLGQVPG